MKHVSFIIRKNPLVFHIAERDCGIHTHTKAKELHTNSACMMGGVVQMIRREEFQETREKSVMLSYQVWLCREHSMCTLYLLSPTPTPMGDIYIFGGTVSRSSHCKKMLTPLESTSVE